MKLSVLICAVAAIAGLAGTAALAAQSAATPQPALRDVGTTTLVQLYETSTSADTKETILKYLAEIGDAPARQKLMHVAKTDPNSELREVAIRRLAEHGQTPVLIELYDAEKDSEVRETILRRIAEREDEIARKKILTVAKTGANSDLRERAIRLLAERGQTSLLVELYDGEKDPAVKETILRRLGERDDEVARKKILTVAKTGESADLRERAIRLLAERGHTSLLIELYDAEKNNEVKETILRRFSERDDEASRKKLFAVARDASNPNLQEAAIRAIAKLAAGR
jgi:HEAT repeat protein